jgi:hypothetical protein
MDIKLIKINKNLKLLQDLFNNMSQTLTKDEIQQLVFTDSIRDLFYVVTKYGTPVYRKEVVLSYLINLIAQVSLERVASILDQTTAPSCFGLYGLQTNYIVDCVVSKCFISYCNVETLRLRYRDFEDLRHQVEIKNSDIGVLEVTINPPTTPIQNYDKTILRQLRRWLESYNTKVNEIQISYR